ncbi:hypothetical protein [Asaia spathodeae]|uniref:DUF4398 domain-containing protein n=1 Tax=Asaia spathodeae TaxID=657016 RepID=A0ABX2P7K0_9PROT|nr:hypothetical protein [Asaia spathodeae]GBR17540.1 hypothetical protein AA105894_1845 [Asaia spathodeae NBRC 105894]
MRKLFSLFALIGFVGLTACSSVSQTDLRKAGYATIQAYNATAPLALAYAQQPSADPDIKASIKTASSDAMKVITPLGTDLQSSNPLTALEVSAATAAVAALQAKIATEASK